MAFGIKREIVSALSAPRSAKLDSSAVEVLRVWLGEEHLHCALSVGLGQEEPEASEWGILLARVIRRVAHSIQEHGASDAVAASTDIVDSLLQEIESSSTDPEDETLSE
jgi:hypothetical protein